MYKDNSSYWLEARYGEGGATKEKKIKHSRFQLPSELEELKYNHVRGLYEIQKSKIIYAFPFEMIASLRVYFSNYKISKHSIANWYQTLEKEEKEKVVLSKRTYSL